ncbi:MAG: pterin-4-alpha-carbinolamine dehydratase [Gammaproteobacteria bacterium]|nr:MAG: pterin-4-alpha-carbinolamine dehydratase [Gammaproteobacteria bacterium]
MSLQSKACVPCQGGIPPITEDVARGMMKDIPVWRLIDNARKLERGFEFKNFAQAMQFANRVGAISEEENHHPDITFGWGYCTVIFFTHKIGGLHENDFIMAAKVSVLAE